MQAVQIADVKDQHVKLIVQLLDEQYHTTDHPFCYDPSCPCHEDSLLIAPIAQAVQEGLLTPDEASAIVAGKTL
jgi:hypothetical protein